MTTQINALTVTPEANLGRYLQEIRKFPMLSFQEEQDLAYRWMNRADPEAAQGLVTSHLRLVAKIAMGYRGYGLPVADLISEGNVGLMQAVKKFNPEKGFRLATYAMWWIKAAIQEFILRSWSLVKIGTTAAQKKLFFNLRKLKSRMDAYEEGDLRPDQVTEIAAALDVSEGDVISMNRRMSGSDHSLNAPVRDATGNALEWQDWLADETPNPAEVAEERDEFSKRRSILRKALVELKDRERDIFTHRRLAEPAKTLEELSQIYNISRERVRQIETRAMEKVQAYVEGHSDAPGLMA